jgi:phosphatidate cytidylyltransferase
MVYKNLYNRLFFSIFFFAIYFFALNNKFLLFFFGSFLYLFVLYEIIKFFNKFFKIILLYLILSYLCFSIYFFISYDFLIFNIFVFTIISFDSLSYFTGKVLGKNFIFKYISPKKTLEGYLGGVFFTNISAISYFYFMNFETKIIPLIVLVNLTIFISIFGDLIESYFKRKNNIKDSSEYLPGHGGFFDRFDSFIASIIMLTIFSLL